MSETGTREWTVEGVREGDVVDNPHGGKLQKFYVDFEGSPDTYWRRKSGDTPEIGKSYYGTISEGQYGPMFKKEKPQDGGGSSGSSASRSGGSTSREYGGKKDWQAESERDPEKAARIGRMASQKVAADIAVAAGYFDGEVTDGVFQNFTELVDKVEADVDAAAKAARSGGSASGNAAGDQSSSFNAPPVQSGDEARGVHERLTVLLEGTGQNDRAAKQMADFALDQMTPEEQDAAIGMLEKPERQVAAVERLRERTEGFNGEPLPSAGKLEDDIPFARPEYDEPFSERERWSNRP